MTRLDRPHRQSRRHHFAPGLDDLEDRRLPSFFGAYSGNYYNQVAYQASIVRHEYDAYVGELKRLELASSATTAEYLALRDDTREISLAASPGKLPDSVVQLKAVETSLELDRAPLDGWFGDNDWAQESARLSADLSGLNVPQSIIEQTVTDMRALATSANVGPFDFATFTDDFDTLRNGEQSLPANSGYHFEDPSLYYTQHLRGFFRGWGVERLHAQAKLNGDLAAIQHRSRTTPSGSAVLQRDTGILKNIGAALPSDTEDQFDAAYVAAFAQGTPTAAGLAQLRTSLITILGPAATASRTASVSRLVGDAPAFYLAAGSSVSHVQTIVSDVGTLVGAGGGETLNPFKVTIQPG